MVVQLTKRWLKSQIGASDPQPSRAETGGIPRFRVYPDETGTGQAEVQVAWL